MTVMLIISAWFATFAFGFIVGREIGFLEGVAAHRQLLGDYERQLRRAVGCIQEGRHDNP